MRSDVVVAGASAAGLYCAERLAREGRSVRVIERSSRFPGAARTLITTHRLRDVLRDAAEGSIVNEISGFELFADGRVAEIELRKPDLIVERATIMQELADRAKEAGAEIALGRRFLDVTPSADGMDIVTGGPPSDNGRIATRTLVGADGALSRVARRAGWTDQPTVPLVQAVVRLPKGVPSDVVRVWFRPEQTPYFYWFIPEGDGRAAVGLIGDRRHTARKLLNDFLKEKDLFALSYQAAQIPLYRRWRPVRRKVHDATVYLVGDAAGHVKPSTVGGLVTGFKGARAVADDILGRSSDLKSLRRELDRHSLVRRMLDRFGEPDYKRLLDLIRRPEHRLLGSHSRDDTHRLLWRLCLREPRLVTLTLARLLRSAG